MGVSSSRSGVYRVVLGDVDFVIARLVIVAVGGEDSQIAVRQPFEEGYLLAVQVDALRLALLTSFVNRHLVVDNSRHKPLVKGIIGLAVRLYAEAQASCWFVPAIWKSEAGAKSTLSKYKYTPAWTAMPTTKAKRTRFVFIHTSYLTINAVGIMRSPSKSAGLFTTLPLRYSVELEPPSKLAAMTAPSS